MTIPIALVHGLVHVPARGPARIARGDRSSASSRLLARVVLGKPLAGIVARRTTSCFSTHAADRSLIAAYGFVASVLPVWLLLARATTSQLFMKIGTIALLVVGVIVVNPALQMPAFNAVRRGGGPIVPGTLFPFVFITIVCGAISGFHALIASGTTPKMIDKESRHPRHRLRRDADARGWSASSR